MKLHFESTGDQQAYRAGKPLDYRSIREAMSIALAYSDQFATCLEQSDGSMVVEIVGIAEEKKRAVITMAQSICGYGDMRVKELE